MKRKFLYLYFWFLFAVCTVGACASENGTAAAIQEALECPYIYQSVNVITGEYCESETDLQLNGPCPLAIRRCYSSADSIAQGWHFNQPNFPVSLGIEPKEAMGGKLRYTCDQEGRLAGIDLCEGGGIFHVFDFSYRELGEGNSECTVQTDDGHFARYFFTKNEATRAVHPYLLQKVVTSKGKDITYGYREHPRERRKLIARRDETCGRYLETEYYDSFVNNVGGTIVKISDLNRDPRIGKVKLQRGPRGVDETPVIVSRFFYHADYTEVYDALNHKTIYRFGKNRKLTSIENYLEDETLYRVERFFWNKEDQLASRSIEDSEGTVHCCQTFEYDSFGNVAKQTLFGNLSGWNNAKIILNDKGQPADNGVECYTLLYRYSEDDKNRLIFQSADNGGSMRFLYEHNGRLSCKLTYDREALKIREFFQYDSRGHLTVHIVDDGSSENMEDLSGISERRITRYHPKSDAPGAGRPEFVEESYFDKKSGKEVLLKRTVFTYSSKGEVVHEDSYDAAGSLFHSQDFEYDNMGRLIQSIDSEGNIKSLSYDGNGNVVHISENNIVKTSIYDLCNRLLRSEQHHKDGSVEATSYRYDFAGNRTASIDIFGNETCYEYDGLGRLIKTTYPLVSDLNGHGFRPTVTTAYDIMDRAIATTDPNGYMTSTAYNVRGNPVKVMHSDGSIEKYEYNLDGTLKKKIFKDGSYTLNNRDFKSRITSEEHFSSLGQLIKGVFREYSSFQLAAEADHSGKSTLYSYDGAGRHIGTRQELGNGSKHTSISYDNKGQAASRKEWYGDDSKEGLIASVERGKDDKIAAFLIHDADGNVIKKREFAKEKNGEDESHVRYNYDAYDEWGQNVLQTISTNSSGITAATLHDALGRPVRIEKTDSLGRKIQEKEIFYDAVGNKVKEVHRILESGMGEESYACTWSWGPGNRLETATEGYGTDQERTTRFSYYLDGKVESITKPDGVLLFYQYSEDGQPVMLKSSDGTVDYAYTYDSFGRVIAVDDRIRSTTTLRKYNSQGQITYERLGNGLAFENEYDLSGRRVRLTLPDKSRICYRYDAAYLRSIDRESSEGERSYSHVYSRYSLTGKIAEEQLIGGLGILTRCYDQNDLLQSIDTPYWRQRLERCPAGRIHSSSTEDPLGQFLANYQYDDSGQLIKETSLENHDYSYDSLRNRIKADDLDVCIDPAGQLLAQGDLRCSYDRNGCLTSVTKDSEKTFFEYDALNRLVKVTKKGVSFTYIYDAFHRRLSSTKWIWNAPKSEWAAEEAELFLYDGNNEIGKTDPKGTIAQLRVLGVGLGAEIGAAAAIEIENKIYAPIHDHRGSVACLVSVDTGKPAEWYRYGAFGKAERHSDLAESVGNPWTFSSKRLDAETGLVFFGHRYYQPETGRWITKDPLGNPESINRYAFTLNDPINNVDPFGLFSFSALWDTVWGSLKTAYEYVVHTINTFKNFLSVTDYVTPIADQVGQFLFGKTFLQLSGFYKDASETGVHGRGEISDKVRITLINGILNARCDYKMTLDLVSDSHGGANVHYIFDATEGWCWDILKCLLVKCGYVSPQAYMIADTWKKMIEEMGGVDGGGIIYHYAHSIGATHTKAALKLMTPEEKAMICIYTFGSPSSIYDEDLNSVFNYVSVRDGVCLMDPVGYFSGLLGLADHIIPVGDWMGIPFVDHMLASGGTYVELIKLLGAHFLELFVLGQ